MNNSRCIAAGFPTNLNDLQKRETFIKKQKSKNVTKDEYESEDPNARKHESDHVYWMAEDEPVKTAESKLEASSSVNKEGNPMNIEAGYPVKLEVKCEPPDFEPIDYETKDHEFIKSEPVEHDEKIEPGVDSILNYDPLAENIEDVQMNEVVINTVEADHMTQEISNEVSKTTKPEQKVRDPLETSQPNQGTINPSPNANEKDPLDTVSQACCHICQAEAPGMLFYGGICCYSCR